MGPLEVDLFASRLTAQCPAYFSWRPDPFAQATDALVQDWTHIRGFANPPWALMGRVLSHTQSQQAQVVLLAPIWKTQPWYPVLLEMLVDFPRRIPQHVQVTNNQLVTIPQLAVWPISGKSTEVRSFRRRLAPSCSAHGGPKLTSLTTHSLESGIAGVIGGIQIPFQVL